MGAGASSGLSEERELEIFEKLRDMYHARVPTNASPEDDPKLFAELKRAYLELTADAQEKTSARPSMRRSGSTVADLLKESVTSTELSLCLGDVVRAKTQELGMFFEGVIVDANPEERSYLVDFGDEDAEWVAMDQVQRVMPWGALEVGDTVQARPIGEHNYYTGRVCRIHVATDGLMYDIEYEDCDEVDEKIPSERVRKINSVRCSIKKFQAAVKKVQALNYMIRIGGAGEAI